MKAAGKSGAYIYEELMIVAFGSSACIPSHRRIARIQSCDSSHVAVAAVVRDLKHPSAQLLLLQSRQRRDAPQHPA